MIIPLATIVEYPLSFASLDYPHLLTPTAADAKRGELATGSLHTLTPTPPPTPTPTPTVALTLTLPLTLTPTLTLT